MPSDGFYEKLYEAEDKLKAENIKKRKEECKKLFSNRSIKEKVDFLIERYIEGYIEHGR